MTIKRFGLIGHPIAHSLSPALFKAGYDGRYPYELIETADFEEAYARFLEGYDGINVTAPFKELAYAKAEILTDECKTIGATNLLVKTSEGIKAYNSDYLGVRMWLEVDVLSACEKRVTPLAAGTGEWLRNSPVDCFNEPARSEGVGGVLFAADTHRMVKVLIVGLGGAGKAAAAAAESLGMEVIRMNRTIKDDTVRPLDDFTECFREADIIIYNIPTAIPSLNELTDSDFTPGKPKFIMEANYKNPSFDEGLIDRMKRANPLAEYTGGRTWLLYQAVTGYEIFTGEKPDLAMMSDVL
jgi:shikimate 5-dehydrogenase